MDRQKKWDEKYVGNRVGKLTIVEVILEDKISCRCMCDCGKECIKSIASIHQKRKTLSCGCSIYQYKKGNQSYKWKGYGEISARFWHREKANARKRNIDFLITIEDAWDKFVNQNKRCTISNEIITFGKSTYDYGTASLDRIDSQKPYTISNTRWIHKDLNNMKWDLLDKDFFNYCKLLLEPIQNDFSSDCNEKIHHKNWRGCGNISGDFWYRIKKNASVRNINLEISIEDIWNLFIQQKGCCKLTGLPLTLTEKRFTASLDRLNNDIGYTKDNIIWIHKDINCKIKKDLPLGKIIEWCKKIKRRNFGRG